MKYKPFRIIVTGAAEKPLWVHRESHEKIMMVKEPTKSTIYEGEGADLKAFTDRKQVIKLLPPQVEVTFDFGVYDATIQIFDVTAIQIDCYVSCDGDGYNLCDSPYYGLVFC